MALSTDAGYQKLLGRIWCDSVALIELIACRRVLPENRFSWHAPALSSPPQGHAEVCRSLADRAIVQRIVAQLPWSSKRLRMPGTEISETVSRNSMVSHRPTMILPTSAALVAPELIEKLFARFTLGWSHYVTLLSIDSNDALVELTLPLGGLANR